MPSSLQVRNPPSAAMTKSPASASTSACWPGPAQTTCQTGSRRTSSLELSPAIYSNRSISLRSSALLTVRTAHILSHIVQVSSSVGGADS